MTYDYTSNLSAIGLLILANAFFVAAEFALVRVRRTRVEELAAEGNPTAKIVKHAMEHIDDYISATQVGVTLASLALGWLGEKFMADAIFLPFFTLILPSPASLGLAHGLAVAIAFFAITFLHVVIGELTPKSLALQYPEKVSLWLIRPMRLIKVLFGPFVWMLRGASSRLLKLLGAKPVSSHAHAMSEEELLMLLAESKRAGVVSAGEQQMLQRVFKFHDKTAREIMLPRPDIAALSLRASEDDIRVAFEQGYSRVPVYDKNLNNVKGIVYVKDLIYTLQNPKLIKLVDLLREALFVPETQPVSTLLQEFQKRKVHMAIVIDEFGDTAGLVTLEDVIEEIVGEIQDEYDSEPAEVQRGRDGAIIFDGKTSVERLRELFPSFEMPEGDFETVAGLVFKLAGRVPKEADVLRHSGFSFRVVKREGRRLKKIAVERLPAAALEEHHDNSAETPTAQETAASVEITASSDGELTAATIGIDPADAVKAEVLATEPEPANARANGGSEAHEELAREHEKSLAELPLEAAEPPAEEEQKSSAPPEDEEDADDLGRIIKSPTHLRAVARTREKRRRQ